MEKMINQITFLIMLLFFTTISAQNTATTTGSWNNCATWGNPPTIFNNNTDTKTINSGVTVIQNTAWSTNNVLLNGTGGITFASSTNSIDLVNDVGNDQACTGVINSLDCNGGSVSHSFYRGTTIPNAITVTRTVPYSGGNGGTYNPIISNSTGVTGLTATLASGTFLSNGNLSFRITGTPLSIGTASFAISVGGQSCAFSVNVQDENAVNNPRFDGGTSGWQGNGCMVWSYGSFCPDFTQTPVGSTADQSVCYIEQVVSNIHTYGATLSFEIGWGYGEQGGVLGEVYYNGVLYARLATRNINDITATTYPQNNATGAIINTVASSNVAHVNFTLPAGIPSSGVLQLRMSSIGQSSGDSVSFANISLSKGY
jgi:hypothetical protein